MFLTNNFTLLAAASYALCNARWQAELLFKWVKQHLRSVGKCGKATNLDRCLGPCPRHHRQETSQPECVTLHVAKDFSVTFFEKIR
jgi:hypothetical protein